MQADAERLLRELQQQGDQLLNENLFFGLDHAQQVIGSWADDYNSVRPHSAIGNKVPAALHRSACNPGQLAAR